MTNLSSAEERRMKALECATRLVVAMIPVSLPDFRASDAADVIVGVARKLEYYIIAGT